jgi:hypothetical protein
LFVMSGVQRDAESGISIFSASVILLKRVFIDKAYFFW